ncbi:hypothetical protein [Streptomyces sp. JJ36]|uniref:hypothetical protein n=1 Tax=Streptomyces sp. JJ36 TaxID=2736645 RepID=UPI001F3AFE32|nr:hypothetical protein [Streptomyces sp. JJ36]MCF6522106.1 hypothetical protein [Streptomyces sp. JJ36]
MSNPYNTVIPPTPRQPDTRPLRQRKRVWIGGSGLLLVGVLIGGAGDGGREPAAAEATPATTVTATATATATPEPGPTVTETVKAEAKPGPTVTVTKTSAPVAADTDTGSSGNTGDQDGTGTCSIVSSSGNCYSAGQFCRNSDHGAVTTTASGARIKCTYSSNAWRWSYV